MTEMTQVTHLLIDRAGQGDESCRVASCWNGTVIICGEWSRHGSIVASHPASISSDVVQDTLAEAARQDGRLLEGSSAAILWVAAAHRGGMRDPDASQACRLAQAERRVREPDARATDASAVGLVRSLMPSNDTSPSNPAGASRADRPAHGGPGGVVAPATAKYW